MKMAVKDEKEEADVHTEQLSFRYKSRKWGGAENASPWPEEYKIPGIRDASVKLIIKMAVKDEEEEADVQNMVKLMSCGD